MPVYAGIDVHRNRSQAAVAGEGGKVLANRNVTNGVRPVLPVTGGLPAGTPAAYEATFGRGRLAGLLEGYGFEPHMARPLQCKAIASARLKNDKGRRGHARAAAARRPAAGGAGSPRRRSASCGRCCGTGRSWSGCARCRATGSTRSWPATAGPRARVLIRLPGAGVFTALVLLAGIGDITRFGPARKLASRAGLTPAVRGSDRTVRHGHIPGQGPAWVRWVACQAAQTARRHPDFAPGYEALARRRGKKIAATAVARKLLPRACHLLTGASAAGEPG